MLIMAWNRLLAALVAATSLCSIADAGQRLPGPLQDQDFAAAGERADTRIELGKQLFFDKILSGNLNISCATCHHPFAGTGDGLSLPVGEGANGTGVARDTGSGFDAVQERVPRNAPAIFNLGAHEFTTLFHDGRIEPDIESPGGIASPAGTQLPVGLDNALAAQAMFPVTSGTEMAGQTGENPIADAAANGNLAGPNGVWEQLADRLRGIDGYVSQFIIAFDDVGQAEDIRFVHAANAIAAFEAAAWRSDNSPFDQFLRGESTALSPVQKRGMHLFYGSAGCSGCHGGALQTDHSFHAIAMPQIGPGKGDGPTGREDFGRERVSGDPADRYRFRVPSLRNVALTAPYGHSGAYNTLDAVVYHHLNPLEALENYDRGQVRMPRRPDLDAYDGYAMNDPSIRAAIAAANELPPVELRESDIRALIEFLHALTDTSALDMRSDVPASVPSGLSVAD
jgi:cytochrome c peroxidase